MIKVINVINMDEVKEILNKINEGQYKLSKNEKSKSIIWTIFYRIQKEDGSMVEDKVYCQGCNNIFKYNKQHTSNLAKHKCVHSKPHNDDPIQINSEDRNACVETFMNFIVEDCRPFSSVEGKGFRKMIEKCVQMGAKYGANIDFEQLIPTAKTLSRKTTIIAEEKKIHKSTYTGSCK